VREEPKYLVVPVDLPERTLGWLALAGEVCGYLVGGGAAAFYLGEELGADALGGGMGGGHENSPG
jgi:hypothetical protein